MEAVTEARDSGLLRYVGFSAHSVEAALAALDRFAFDSVLFPFNHAAWQAGFGPQLAWRTIERRITYGAQQHGVGLHDCRPRLGRERIACRGDPRGSNGMVTQVELQSESLARSLQHAHRFARDLRADAVSRQDGDRKSLHHVSPFPFPVSRACSYAPIRSSSRSVRPISSSPESSISR